MYNRNRKPDLTFIQPFVVNEESASIIASLEQFSLGDMLRSSERLTLDGFGPLVTYSKKVFIPLTRICRNVCHYCTFATHPSKMETVYLSAEAVLEIAHAGQNAGCPEALFMLGERPEDRFEEARTALARLGHTSTLSYLGEMASLVISETGLLPHLNPGLLSYADYAALRPVSASMGLMLETASKRLSIRGGPHYGSPGKYPVKRLAAIEEAGRAAVPFTTGLLIGIGETRAEQIEALVAIRNLHQRYGHIQEVILQNFRAKTGTKMADFHEPSLDEHLWTIAAARLILGSGMVLQAPPNLHSATELAALLRAGINDWGGVSPVTSDHVNPEAPWPHIEMLDHATASSGRMLRERMAIGPAHACDAGRWLDSRLRPIVLRAIDGRGMPVVEAWRPGIDTPMPVERTNGLRNVCSDEIDHIVDKACEGRRLESEQIVRLFEAEGDDFNRIVEAADRLRRVTVGDKVTYVINRNISYTNICLYKCGFCGFSKNSMENSQSSAYRLDLAEVARRCVEADERGATEVCLQGGIHPDYTGDFYLEVLSVIRSAAPDLHIHAFSPLEVMHGARTLGLSLRKFLTRLKNAGLGSLPGTAAEILDDQVRAVICPNKVTTAEWLEIVRTAHQVGLRSTATIMFGHVESYIHWARHLLAIRDLQQETCGFTEFVPLPFVHMEAPIWHARLARSGPSARETLLMYAVSRLVLNPVILNIQTSWVKLGLEGVIASLRAGVNDLGGTLMDESITSSAGGRNGQCFDPDRMVAAAAQAGRIAIQRTTLYNSDVTNLLSVL